MSSAPLISCLMVTGNRSRLARRALECFRSQTYANRELVIIDDGAEDYEPMLRTYRDSCKIHYHRVLPEEGRFLGGLRNLSLDAANGDVVAQWDDDEWYHPERLQRQAERLFDGVDVCYLKNTLVHVNTPEMTSHIYRTDSRDCAIPGTVMHRRCDVRYANMRRGEDSQYLDALRSSQTHSSVEGPHTHLFIRCFHGANTWDAKHFLGTLSGKWKNRFFAYLATRVFGDICWHPAFRLTELERETVMQFLSDSRRLALLDPANPSGTISALG